MTEEYKQVVSRTWALDSDAEDSVDFSVVKDYYLVSLESDFQERSFRIVEPFTWGWVGVKLCEGVISAIGAEVFKNALGLGKIDFATFQIDLIAAIERALRLAIEEENKRRLEVSVTTIRNVLVLYLNDPRAEWLSDMIVAAQSAINEAKSLGIVAAPCYAVTGSTLLVLLDLATASSANPVGAKRNIVLTAESLVRDVDIFRDQLHVLNRRRFRGPVYEEVRRVPEPGDRPGIPNEGSEKPRPSDYFYYCDGSRYRLTVLAGETPDQAFVRVRQIEWYRLEKEFVAPLYAVKEKWIAVIQKIKGQIPG